MAAEQGGSQIVRLRGTGGMVDISIASFLPDLMQQPTPCSYEDCCELNDDAELEVYITLHCERAHVALNLFCTTVTLLLQGVREACSPVQLLQLLQAHLYPEKDATELAAQWRARVFIYSKIKGRRKRLSQPPSNGSPIVGSVQPALSDDEDVVSELEELLSRAKLVPTSLRRPIAVMLYAAGIVSSEALEQRLSRDPNFLVAHLSLSQKQASTLLSNVLTRLWVVCLRMSNNVLVFDSENDCFYRLMLSLHMSVLFAAAAG
jgi:hypothetical protein